MRVLIVGAGGHAHVVGDALLMMTAADRNLSLAGYLDDDETKQGSELPGGRVVGRVADRDRIAHDAVVIAIGESSIREELFRALTDAGERFIEIRHPSAVVAQGVNVGVGTVIMAGVVVNAGSRIGRNVILNTSCSVDHHCDVGDHTHLAPGVRLGGGVSVGLRVFVGLGALLLPGRRVGDFATIGAGAVVIRDVSEGALVVGNPARPIDRGIS